MITRHITSEIIESLEDSPVVLINGAWQVGKSTLAKLLAQNCFGGNELVQYVTFDNATVLTAARSDPDGYVDSLSLPVVIDEIQRVTYIFRSIKLHVDSNRKPG